jgi:hypothetical protein
LLYIFAISETFLKPVVTLKFKFSMLENGFSDVFQMASLRDLSSALNIIVTFSVALWVVATSNRRPCTDHRVNDILFGPTTINPVLLRAVSTQRGNLLVRGKGIPKGAVNFPIREICPAPYAFAFGG